MSTLKGTDRVYLHPATGKVHEQKFGDSTKLACGNPFDKIPYRSVTRNQANGVAGSSLCQSTACRIARGEL